MATDVLGRCTWRCPQHGLRRFVMDFRGQPRVPIVYSEPCLQVDILAGPCNEILHPVYEPNDQRSSDHSDGATDG